MTIWAKKASELFRFTRAERALTLAIFLVLQALVPSYAGALSSWSDNDRLVICSAHGIIDIAGEKLPLELDDDDGLCLIMQSMAVQALQNFAFIDFTAPQMGASIVDIPRLNHYLRSHILPPNGPRAPPISLA